MIVCAGNSESFPFALSIGVGLVESSINLTRLCLFDKPERLLFVGSAGSYGKYNIFDVVHTKSASQIELSYIDKLSYTPIDNVISTDNVSCETPIVNSSNYITTSKSHWDFFQKNNIHLENMEFFSVMRVAQEFDIAAGGLFVVTNYCDANAHNDFITNHKQAKGIIAKEIEKLSL
jgi:nucleoside phosphorylase